MERCAADASPSRSARVSYRRDLLAKHAQTHALANENHLHTHVVHPLVGVQSDTHGLGRRRPRPRVRRPVALQETPQTPAVCLLQVLEMVAVLRPNGEWAIPGGMVSGTEGELEMMRREFTEEAADVEPTQRVRLEQLLRELFDPEHAREVFSGYVDDPRNTDHAWIETQVHTRGGLE